MNISISFIARGDVIKGKVNKMELVNLFRDYRDNILAMAAFVAWLWFFPLFGILQTFIPAELEKIIVFNLTFLFATFTGYIIFLCFRNRPALNSLILLSAPSVAIFTWLTVFVFWQTPPAVFIAWAIPSILLFIIFPAIMGLAGAFYFAFWGTTIFYVPEGIRGRYMGIMVVMATLFYSVIISVFQAAPLPALFLSGLFLLIPSLSINKLFAFIVHIKEEALPHAPPGGTIPPVGGIKNSAFLKTLKTFWLPFSLVILCFYILAWATHDIIFSVIKTESILSNVVGQGFYALVCITAAILLDKSREIEKTAVLGLIMLGCTFLLLPIALSFGFIPPLYFLLEGSYGLIDLFMWVSLAYFCQFLRGDPRQFYAVGLSLNVLFIVAGILLMPILDLNFEGDNYFLLSFLAGIVIFIGILPALSLRKVRFSSHEKSLLNSAVSRELEKLSLAGNSRPEDFTKKEQEIICLMLYGIDNQEISKRLKISKNTLKTHVRHIYEKAGVKNRSELLFKFAGFMEKADI